MKNFLFFSTAFISLLLFSCLSYSASAVKHFSDYVEITPTKKSNPSVLRTHYNAKQKINDRTEDPTYKKNQWKLVMRRGLYKAQVEMAMSEIYRYFQGFSTDIDFVEEKNDFFIARREFKHFDKWDDVFKKVNSQFYVNNYVLQDDGNLVKGNSVKKFSGLANIVAIAEFFGDSDAKNYNYGIQENDFEVRVIDPDLEDAFNFSAEQDIEQALVEEYGEELIKMSWYQQEKKAMLNKIAATDFSVIENMIRKHVTVSSLSSRSWVYEKILQDPSVFPEMNRDDVKEELKALNSMDETQFNVDKIIERLKVRHQKLRMIMDSKL